MKFSTTSKSPATIRCDVLALITGSGLRDLADQLPAATVKAVRQQARREGFKGELGQLLTVHGADGISAGQLVIAGSGKADRSDAQVWARIMTALAGNLTRGASRSAVMAMPGDDSKAQALQLELATRLIVEALYRFDQYRSKPQPTSKLASLTFAGGNSAAWKKAIARGEAIAAGVNMARDLGNQPPNVCHPDYLVSEARKLANRYDKLKVTVLSEKQAEKMGMGAFCAVARGSERDGKLIAFEYQGAKGKPVALVGKGITFDTGGISLKPGAAMDEMKYDMCGAASVFGTVKAICEMDLPIHLVAVVAAAENMPDGRASRPGDIVRTLSGQTVEILNTDAEGRLVLCDALTWVQQKYQPHTIVDIATLTGACVVALGAHAQAVYANDDKLAEALLDAGKASADRGWQMPLWDDYQQQLDSPFADMANIGGPKAGSITAACFLARFTGDVKWAHLDIAGTAWISGGKSKGATGRPVPMLTRFLQDL